MASDKRSPSKHQHQAMVCQTQTLTRRGFTRHATGSRFRSTRLPNQSLQCALAMKRGSAFYPSPPIIKPTFCFTRSKSPFEKESRRLCFHSREFRSDHASVWLSQTQTHRTTREIIFVWNLYHHDAPSAPRLRISISEDPSSYCNSFQTNKIATGIGYANNDVTLQLIFFEAPQPFLVS